MTEIEKDNVVSAKIAGGILSIIALIAVVILVSSCATIQNKPATAGYVALKAGIRSECIQPPQILEGVGKLFTETCMYAGDGPATCGYILEVDIVRSWACDINMYQDECKTEWYPKAMNCVPWQANYAPLVPHTNGISNE